MYKLSKLLNYFVFIATTVAIAGVFYEGMAVCEYRFDSYDSGGHCNKTLRNLLPDMVTCFLVFLYMVCVRNTNHL